MHWCPEYSQAVSSFPYEWNKVDFNNILPPWSASSLLQSNHNISKCMHQVSWRVLCCFYMTSEAQLQVFLMFFSSEEDQTLIPVCCVSVSNIYVSALFVVLTQQQFTACPKYPLERNNNFPPSDYLSLVYLYRLYPICVLNMNVMIPLWRYITKPERNNVNILIYWYTIYTAIHTLWAIGEVHALIMYKCFYCNKLL